MSTDVLVHVGLMKSGTTFIQGRLGANAGLLEEHSVLFPKYGRQVRAVNDLHGAADARRGAWDSLVEQVRGHDGRSVLSMEFFAPLPPDKIERAAADLTGGTGRIRAVATLRDLGRTVPAMWQEAQQNRRNWTYAEYIEAVRAGTGPGKVFWRQQGAGRIVENWAKALGPENVTIVTVPPPGADPELLWRRFCEVAELPALDWAEGDRANQSLGVVSAVVMGRLNELLDDLDREAYSRQVKMFGKRVLTPRRRQEGGIGFVVPAWLRKRSAQRDKRLLATGVRVVGDLAELAPLDVPGVDPDDVTVEEQLDVALEALAHVLRSRRAGGRGKGPGRA